MTPTEKNELLDKCSVCYSRTNYIKILCEEKGLTNEAVELARRKEDLKRIIDRLLRDLYMNWIGNANSLTEKLRESNMKVEKSIKKIEQNINTTEAIVKAVGYIDNVIKIAGSLLL